MPTDETKCPECGQQGSKYGENHWHCIWCGNKFPAGGKSTAPHPQALEEEDEQVDFGIDFNEGSRGNPGLRPGDPGPIITTNDENDEPLLDTEPEKKRSDEAILSFEDDNPAKSPALHSSSDDLEEEEYIAYEPIPDPDYPDPGEDEQPPAIGGSKNKAALVLFPVAVVLILLIVSFFEGAGNKKSFPRTRLKIPTETNQVVTGRPAKPAPEPVKVPPKNQEVHGESLSPKQVFQKAKPSIALVQVVDSAGQGSQGSGFFIGRGELVTNFHVVEGAERGLIKLVDNQQKYVINAITAKDIKRDLVVLKVSYLGVPPLKIGDSDSLEVGDEVYAIGNPKGLEGTLSDGIVSSLRDPDLIQITAPISPGSSGGPVLNNRGEVIGIATSGISEGQNLNFAVPAKHLKYLLSQPRNPIPLSPGGFRSPGKHRK